jgi:methionine-rich copper-binding protein CopC
MSRLLRSIRLGSSAVLILLVLVVSPIRPVLAHAVLVENSIGDKPVPANTALTVTFRFNAALEQSFFRATLIGPGKERHALETMPGKDKTEEIIKLPPLVPGKYAIGYTALAADSHLTDSLLRFTVAAPQ